MQHSRLFVRNGPEGNGQAHICACRSTRSHAHRLCRGDTCWPRRKFITFSNGYPQSSGCCPLSFCLFHNMVAMHWYNPCEWLLSEVKSSCSLLIWSFAMDSLGCYVEWTWWFFDLPINQEFDPKWRFVRLMPRFSHWCLEFPHIFTARIQFEQSSNFWWGKMRLFLRNIARIVMLPSKSKISKTPSISTAWR